MNQAVTTQLLAELKALADPDKAQHSLRFFRTGKGEYGEGDHFLGLTVPQQRVIAKKYSTLASIADVQKLLQSPLHEVRLTALMIWTYQFPKATQEQKKAIYSAYLATTHRVNNWDLVDTSAYKIVGEYLIENQEKTLVLEKLAASTSLWEQRIAIVATYAFIKRNQLDHTLHLSELLLNHPHDLIHKAVGWMLREAGKRDNQLLLSFLNKHAAEMPSTMLRYSLEKQSPQLKEKYMNVLKKGTHA